MSECSKVEKMLPSLSELTIGVQTLDDKKGAKRARDEEEEAAKKRAREEEEAARKRAIDEPRFFKDLILRPAEAYPSPAFELSSAIVVEKAGEADVRVDFTVEYEKEEPKRVRVKNDMENDESGDCFYLKFEASTQQAYLGSLLRERDPTDCKVWRVNTTSMQGIGRTLVETTTAMMSHLNRGQEARMNLIDASIFTARNAPLVEWKMMEYLCVKRGYSFYEALGYGDTDHESAEADKEKMDKCLRRNNILFGTALGKLRRTLERTYPRQDPRGQAALKNVEAAMTDEQTTKWAKLSLRDLLEEMEAIADGFDPRNEDAPITSTQKTAILRNPFYLKRTWAGLMEKGGAAKALEILAFLNSLKIDLGMPYTSNMFRKTLYPAADGGHTELLINGDGTGYEEVRVGEGDFRLVGLSSEPKEAARIVRDEVFPRMALLFLPER